MQRLILVGLAGFAGTAMRYWLTDISAKRLGETFPVGTLIVNLTGCLLAGLLFYLTLERYSLSETMRAVVFIGLLGGFTTFSAFGLQTFALLRGGQMGLALMNIGLSNVVGLLMVWIGYSLAKVL